MENKKVGVSIVIPTYNEQERIVQSLEFIKDYLNKEGYDWEIIVSDNGSKDKTGNLVEDFAKKNPQVKLLRSPLAGKGPAVRNGVLASNSNKDYILLCDADLATPIKELERLKIWLLEQDYDVAIASREGLGAFRKGEPYIRHLMGRVFNTVVQALAVPGINDTQCGFKLFRRSVGHKIFGKLVEYRDFKEKFQPYVGAFDVEVLVIARILGYKIKEVPVTWTFVPTKRISHIKDSIKMVRDVIRIRINAIRGYYK